MEIIVHAAASSELHYCFSAAGLESTQKILCHIHDEFRASKICTGLKPCMTMLQVAHPDAAHHVVGGWGIGTAWVHIFGLESFFVPCTWMDHDCHASISLRHQSNAWLPEDLIGHHHYLGSWLPGVEPSPE